jgi:GGDEF domain-containing protein
VTEAETNARANRYPAAKAGLDELTGVWNRAGFIAAATPMFVMCQRRAAPATLGYFDVQSGCATRSPGDDAMLSGVLKSVAKQMGKTFRDCDVIGRIDTFRLAVLFADCTDEALGAIEGVRAVTDESTPQHSNILTVAMVEATPNSTFEDLMHQADLRTHELRMLDVAEPVTDAVAENVAEPTARGADGTAPDDHTPKGVPAKAAKRWARASH